MVKNFLITNVMERIKIVIERIKEAMMKVKEFLRRVVGYISPAYLAMLFAAFVLWYITKLGDTYSTEHEVTVVINGRPYEQECTIRGKGTNLIHYTFSSSHSNFEIPMSELTFDGSVMDDKGRSFRHVNALSMQQALATRMNDIDVVSVGTTPMIEQVKDGSKGK